jgi:poly-gamma-glutamate synthesis protein (capsule biosynthesis protein)
VKSFFKKNNKQVFYYSLGAVIIFILIVVLSYKEKSVSVINFGDVMLDRGVRNIVDNRGRDPFEYIKKDRHILDSYDFRIVNLEGPIIVMDRALCQQKIYNFQFPPNTPDKLKEVGINLVNIANNHSLDCYRKGFISTKEYLSKANIQYVGDMDYEKSFYVKEVNGKKVAFVGIDAVTPPIPVSGFYNVIKKLKAENDYVVVNIHWGEEYNLGFTQDQKNLAHKLVDSGADVIFGHHPHVVEPVEVYKKGIIFYSLGNFVFDQDFGDTTIGLGAGVRFYENKILVQIYPFNIKKFAPDFMKSDEKKNYCEKYLKDFENKDCSFEIKL